MAPQDYPLSGVVTGSIETTRRDVPALAQDGARLDRYAALAAANGQLETLKLLHGAGACLVAGDQLALRLAAATGRVEILDYLLAHGASVESCSAALVQAAARNGHATVLERLRTAGCDLASCAAVVEDLVGRPGLAPVRAVLAGAIAGLESLDRLVSAIQGGSLDAVKAAFLNIDHTAHAGLLFEAAARAGSAPILRFIHESGAPLAPHAPRVMEAVAQRGHAEVLRLLVTRYGCDPAASAGSAAALAAENGHFECLELLWTSGGAKRPPAAVTLALADLNGHHETYDYLTSAGGLDGIAAHRETLRAMTEQVSAADPIYHPSQAWIFFNEVNLEQLRHFGMSRFKRSVNQNYFNYLPLGLRDPQLARLLPAFGLRFPVRTLLGLRLEDPDRYTDSGKLVAPEWRVFRLWQDSAAFGALGRLLQRALYRLLVGLLWRRTELLDEANLRADLQEPALGGPIITATNGRLVSQDLAHSILECNTILAGLEESARPLRFAELGAGYGRVGDVLLSSRDCRYFVFDIPPGLLVSQWYLSSRHSQKRIFRFRRFARFEDVRADLESADLAFFTPDQIPLFPDGYFDIAINISSLHEMRRDQQRHLLAELLRIAASRVYLKQYRHYVNPWDRMEVLENDYAVAPGWRKRLWREDRVDPRNFEAILEREVPWSRTETALAPPPRRPTVSILLANYNHGAWLHTSLEGILAQSDPADEIIVVDDGSSDDSIEVITAMLARHPNARLVRHERNRGQHAAVQRALLEASGDYIAWASSDDLLLPDFVARSRAALQAHPGCGLAFSRLCTWRDGGPEVNEYTGVNHGPAFDLGHAPLYFSPRKLREMLQKHYVWISGNTVLARRDLLIEMGGFHRELRWHADWFTFYAIALRAGAVGIPETLAMMREPQETYSRQGMRDSSAQQAVLGALLDTLDRPQYSDLRAVVRRCPSLLSPFGPWSLFLVAVRRPGYWRLAFGLLLSHGRENVIPRLRQRLLRAGSSTSG